MNEPSGAQESASPAHAEAATITKVLSFRLGSENHAVEISRVRELIRSTQTTRIPGAPRYLRGLLNLRGKVIPVIDARIRLGMSPCPLTKKTAIIIFEQSHNGQDYFVGLMVDEMRELLTARERDIEPPTSVASCPAGDYAAGVIRHDGSVIFLLDDSKCTNLTDLGV